MDAATPIIRYTLLESEAEHDVPRPERAGVRGESQNPVPLGQTSKTGSIGCCLQSTDPQSQRRPACLPVPGANSIRRWERLYPVHNNAFPPPQGLLATFLYEQIDGKVQRVIMPVALTVLILSVCVPTAIASNSTLTATVGWVADPTGRGTFSLIFSCLLTLGLCVWSAMHLNIPPHDESPAQSWMRNFRWGLTGVVAPELVVFAAWRQYNSAKALYTEVQKALDIQRPVLSRRGKDRTIYKVNKLRSAGLVFLRTMLTIV